MTIEQDGLFIPDSAPALRDDLLTDLYLEGRKFGTTAPAVTPGTDNYSFCTAVANAGMMQYGNLSTIKPSITPLTATGQDLDDWRSALGLPVVSPSPASGKLTVNVSGGGSVTLIDGQAFLYPSGLRGKVNGTQMGIFDEQDVDVIAIDTGDATNLDIGTKVRWVNPPFNVATEARVSINGPLTGGYDAETESRKRERVLNRLRNTPGGGNWGQMREIAFNALPSVIDANVYPALGGPSSDKLVILKGFDRKRNDYHRAFQSAGVDIVRTAIHAELSTADEHVVSTVDEEACDLALELSLPASSLAGGNGLGWVDQRPWPPASSGAHVAITGVAGFGLQITVNAATVTSPVIGQTHIMWWSASDMTMRTYLVTGVSGSTGAWVLTLDQPAVDDLGNTAAAGDYISPAAANGDKYGATFIDLMEALGAGENTADASRLPRSARHPFIGEGSDISITNKFVTDFLKAHREIVDGDLSYLPVSSPSVPTLVSSNPNALVPRHFGIVVMP
jgi:hypothetical protein